MEQKNNKMNLTALVLPAFLAGSCATAGYSVRPQHQISEQTTQAQLEALTAAGQFSTIAAYVHQQIDAHPNKYMNELYEGADIALKHAPNGVYQLAIDQYAEDVQEYMETRIYTMQQMQEKGGFAFSYDVNYDE